MKEVKYNYHHTASDRGYRKVQWKAGSGILTGGKNYEVKEVIRKFNEKN